MSDEEKQQGPGESVVPVQGCLRLAIILGLSMGIAVALGLAAQWLMRSS